MCCQGGGGGCRGCQGAHTDGEAEKARLSPPHSGMHALTNPTA